MKLRNFKAIAVIGAAALGLAVAQADVSETIFMVKGTDESGYVGTYSVALPQATLNIDQGTYGWGYNADGSAPDIDVYARDASGNLIEDDQGRNILVFSLRSASLGLDGDPQVNLGFTLVAGNSTTTFLVQSALLSFAPLLNPSAITSATLQVTDSANFNGATMSKLVGTGGMYRSEYNGFVPGGTPFSELINSVSAPALGSNSMFDSSAGVIAGSVSNMSAQVNFTLTPRDTASGTTDYRITPEPTSLALLGLAALFLRRR